MARIMRFDGSADGPHAVAVAPGVIAVSEMMLASRAARVRIWQMPK
ncbi:MAG: hypothetical protein M3680_02390 [Myxococcota bacterium]|nr:hypothetical protein [Myxococcota bacterium]